MPLPAVPPPPAGEVKPAATQWSPFPSVPPTAAAPLPQLTPLETPRTVVFQKPAGGEVPAVLVRQEKDKDQKPVENPQPKTVDPKLDPKAKDKADPGAALPVTPARDLPTPADVFRFDSDTELNRRILRELKKETGEFPAKVPVVAAGTQYQVKTLVYPPTKLLIEPNWVVHRRLYYEEKNAERAGWDFGLVQPIVSAAYFYKDALFWPHNLASGFCRNRYDTSAGKCLPGDPTPYYLYPPGLTASGTFVEAVIVTGSAFIVP